MSLPPFLSAVVGWLKAGYPNGVPEADYVPLLALLTRRLSNEEVQRVAGALMESQTLPTDDTDIGVVITRVTDELPREEDVERVRARLTAVGWPVAD